MFSDDGSTISTNEKVTSVALTREKDTRQVPVSLNQKRQRLCQAGRRASKRWRAVDLTVEQSFVTCKVYSGVVWLSNPLDDLWMVDCAIS